MHIIQIASEAVPFAKTGGLGDVVGALPLALAKERHEVTIIMPYYTAKISKKHKIRNTETAIKVGVGAKESVGEIFSRKLAHNVNAYFVKNDAYFGRPELYQTADGDYKDNAERFIFFCRAALQIAAQFKPDIIHLHDWQSAMAAVYLKSTYKNSPAFAKAKCLLTIHNLGYQGLFPRTEMPLTGLPWEYFTFDKLEFHGKLSFLKGGIAFADAVSTVSKKYAQEILTPEYGCGLEGALEYRKNKLYGIVNGIDYNEWSPSRDEFLPAKFTPKNIGGKAACKAHVLKTFNLPIRGQALNSELSACPLIGMISRLTSQKGFDLLAVALPELIQHDVQLVILGTGEKKYHELLLNIAKEYPQKIGVKIAFDNALAHQIEAGSDMFLMPSRYEPCGLNQLISLKYGTIPIVRATGGLDDTIRHKENGFKFSAYTAPALLECILEACSAYKKPNEWKKLLDTAFACDFSWDASAREYVELYRKLIWSSTL